MVGHAKNQRKANTNPTLCQTIHPERSHRSNNNKGTKENTPNNINGDTESEGRKKPGEIETRNEVKQIEVNKNEGGHWTVVMSKRRNNKKEPLRPKPNTTNTKPIRQTNIMGQMTRR